MVVIEGYEVSYKIDTVKGQSGAPIFAQGVNDEYFVVGIHTHGGTIRGVNLGLYFQDNILLEIKKQ